MLEQTCLQLLSVEHVQISTHTGRIPNSDLTSLQKRIMSLNYPTFIAQLVSISGMSALIHPILPRTQ